MEFGLTPEQEQFGREFHNYLKSRITPELIAELDREAEYGGPLAREFIRKMGHDGWLGIGWPKEYGGQGRSAMEQHIFFEIASYEGAPLPVLGLNTVGPTIIRFGTEEQKKQFLPPIIKGEIDFAVAYTEPEAGTDLASLKTSAVRDGDDYIINGQKVFTSLAHVCDYIWLAARTDPQAPKHRGISIFVIDANTPGISIKPMYLLGGMRINSTFYDDVRVPRTCLIGEENKGWKYITTQLDFERIMLVPSSPLIRNIEETIQWAKETKLDGTPIIEQPWVKSKFAELIVDVEVLKMLNYYVAWMVTAGIVPYAEASMVKVFGTELRNRVNGSLLQIMGHFGQLQAESKWAPLKGRVDKAFKRDLILTFGGGANEVQRNIIAWAGLGMPRSF